MPNKSLFPFAVVALIPLLAAAAPRTLPLAEISPGLIARQYNKISPSICVVTYSYELTNPGSGQRTKRGNMALGLIVSKAGLVMVRGHMAIENIEPFNIQVKVGRGDNEQDYDAKLLEKPDDINVCFVQIENPGKHVFPAVHFAHGVTLKVGQPLIVIGLLGQTLDFSPAAREIRIGAILTVPRTTYALDDPMLPLGFVGSPAIDAQGQLVGVIGYDLSLEEGGDLYVNSGYPLVFQAGLFQKYIAHPPTENHPTQDAWIGIFTQPLTDDLAQYWGLKKTGGVVVATLVPGAPAQKAGFHRGDIITAFNNVPVKAKLNRDLVTFTKLVRDAGIGKSIPVRILRNGKPMELSVTLGERPKSAQQAAEFKDRIFGLTVREITTDVRIRLNLPENVKGVIVWRVQPGSWAQLANIRPGVIIMRLGGMPVASIPEFKIAVAKTADARPNEVAVFARVGDQTGFFRMNPRWDTNAQK